MSGYISSWWNTVGNTEGDTLTRFILRLRCPIFTCKFLDTIFQYCSAMINDHVHQCDHDHLCWMGGQVQQELELLVGEPQIARRGWANTAQIRIVIISMKVMRFVKVMPGFQEYIEVIKSCQFQIENNLVHGWIWMAFREGFQKRNRKKFGLLPNPPRTPPWSSLQRKKMSS